MHESFATVWETIADAVPDADALVLGERRVSWREFDDHAARFAGALVEAGCGANPHVALYLYNTPEHLEVHFATLKARGVPAPVNHRYRARELAYLLENADARVLVYDRSLASEVAGALDGRSEIRLAVEVGGDSNVRVPGAVAYDDLVGETAPGPRIERSGDDVVLWYTGGTTGMPKGAMWHQGTLLTAGLAAQCGLVGVDVPGTLPELAALVRRLHDDGRAPVLLPLTPLVHATALYQANSVLSLGGRVVMLEQPSLDGREVCEVVERERVTTLPVIGDFVARRIVDELEAADAQGHPYDFSSVRRVHNSGAMTSAAMKDALLSHGVGSFYDSLGSSEGTGYARSVATRPGQSATARFELGPDARVVDSDGRPVGVGEVGFLAATGSIAFAYYNDPERSASTFRTFDGRVYAVPGDCARLEADGSVTLLGRGSGCINTGGEKVWPEEVEEALKEHPQVVDAVVVGVPDDTWGETVAAVVSVEAGATVDGVALGDWVAQRLAGYKRPRRVAVVDEVVRTTLGKADLTWARAQLDAALPADRA